MGYKHEGDERETSRTYERQNLNCGAKYEPGDPLENKKINKIKRTKANENRHLTCLQRRRARPNVPPPLRRKTNNPARMIRSKAMSATIVGMKARSLGSFLTGTQACTEEIHLKRSYGSGNKPGASKTKRNRSFTSTRPIIKTHLYGIPGLLQKARREGTYCGGGIRCLSPTLSSIALQRPYFGSKSQCWRHL
jgi:hypothetical protein